MSGKVNLFQSDSSDSSDDAESEKELKINKDYANRYDQWRHKELLQRYKDLQEEISPSPSESEDEDEPEFDEHFFRILSLLKGNDPKIYDKDFAPFQEPTPETKTKTKKSKPVTIKDYERQVALEANGEIEEKESIKKKTDEAELAKLKSAIMDDDSDDEEDCIKSLAPTPKEKSVDEPEGVIKYLKGGDAEIPDAYKKDYSYLRNEWTDPNIDEGEKFLRDFFLNKKYLDKDDDFQVLEEMEKLSEDEKIEDAQEQFEHKYNFRFEEPDPEFIKRYPRTVGESLRRKDSKRKEKREEYAERKQREKEQKKEELKRLKAVKRKEIENKFFKLQEITGKDNINLDEDDIESDFDPEKHDRKMKELFDDEYYNVEENQKPVFEYDEEIDDEDWNHWTRGENTDAQEEDEKDESLATANTGDINDTHDMDTRNLFVKEMMEKSKDRKRKGRKKSLFARLLSNPKPLYDPKGKSFDEYLEEYYNLDCEDVISDMPVRFKYRKVIPNDFGLSVDEILKADDKELNRWCSIKKTCQYRQMEEEKYDVQAFQKKAQMSALKQNILPSIYSEPKEDNSETEENDTQSSSQKKKQKKKKSKAKTEDKDSEEKQSKTEILHRTSEGEDIESNDLTGADCVKSKNKRKKKKSKKMQNINNDEPSDSACMKEEQVDSVSINDESDVPFNNSSSFCIEEESNKSITSSKRKRKKSKKNKTGNTSTETYSNNANLEDETNKSKVATNNKIKNNAVDLFEDQMNCSFSNEPVNMTPPTKKIKTGSFHHNASGNQPTKKNEVGQFKQIKSGGVGSNYNSNKSAKNHKKNSEKMSNYQQRGNYNYYASNKDQPAQGTDKRLALSDERLAAYGINPKKFKNKMKYSKNTY